MVKIIFIISMLVSSLISVESKVYYLNKEVKVFANSFEQYANIKNGLDSNKIVNRDITLVGIEFNNNTIYLYKSININSVKFGIELSENEIRPLYKNDIYNLCNSNKSKDIIKHGGIIVIDYLDKNNKKISSLGVDLSICKTHIWK